MYWYTDILASILYFIKFYKVSTTKTLAVTTFGGRFEISQRTWAYTARSAGRGKALCPIWGRIVCNLFYVRLVFIQNEDNIPTSDLINIKLIMV